jgi:hypothetical protein
MGEQATSDLRATLKKQLLLESKVPGMSAPTFRTGGSAVGLSAHRHLAAEST